MRELTSNDTAAVVGGSDNPAQAIAGGSLIAGSYAGGAGIGGTGASAVGVGSLGPAGPIGLGAFAFIGGYLVGDYLEDAFGVGSAVGDVVGTGIGYAGIALDNVQKALGGPITPSGIGK